MRFRNEILDLVTGIVNSTKSSAQLPEKSVDSIQHSEVSPTYFNKHSPHIVLFLIDILDCLYLKVFFGIFLKILVNVDCFGYFSKFKVVCGVL